MIENHIKTSAGVGLGDRKGQGSGSTWGMPFRLGRMLVERPRRSCPPWCMEAHIDEPPGERIHSAWLQSIELNAIPLAGQPQRLWIDLSLGPGDAEPRVHLQIEDRSFVELTIDEARSVGTHLIGLAALGVMEIPPTSPA
ncbi:hypothetical protein [Microbispora sp. H10670]|uniref:hypothetical protein n=2 Tax=unclassified Microbispora TaxID=2614687 RepID=UPI001601B31F|nr:hypothetical protein [Microbispora sp. H10670]